MKISRQGPTPNEPTYGATMMPSDAVALQNTKAGLNINSDGQPEIWNKDGDVVQDWANDNVRSLLNVKQAIPVQVALTGVLASGSIANPFGYDVIITEAVLRVTTQSTGASTMDIGVAADAVTSADNLMDGVAGTATGIFNNEDNAGTNGKSSVVWGSAQFVNIAEASGDVAGLIGTLYLTCYRA